MRALPVGFERLPPVAETKKRRSWAAACLGASEAKREGLAATRKSKRAKRSGSGRQAASEAKLAPGTATGAVALKSD